MAKLPRAPSPEKMLRKQLKAFRRKFGRDPGPGDPVFFDPGSDTPTPMGEDFLNDALIAAMQKAGTPPEIVYAYRKTGLLLVESRLDTYPPDDVAEWDAAVREYWALEKQRRDRKSD